MGKIPVFVIPLVIVVLLAGVSFGASKMLVAPKKEQLASLQKQYQDLKSKAGRLESVQKQLEQVEEEWTKAQKDLQHIVDTRSIPISYGMPIEAMLTLAYELRHDLGPVLTAWLESTGCEIVSGATLPAPPGTPQPPPASGFLPEAPNLSITVRGTLEQIEALYKSLHNCPRVLTVGALNLRPVEDGKMEATIPLNVYLLVEAPPGAAGGGGGGGAAGGMGGMGGMPGMGGMGSGMMGPGGGMMGPGGGMMAPGAGASVNPMMGGGGPAGGGASGGEGAE
ncbi:MAG: hypothetical protein J7M26_04875 [Armatimonadetes bacterium]|nr:hypothetical protein [Armatimonadota bacterium]